MYVRKENSLNGPYKALFRHIIIIYGHHYAGIPIVFCKHRFRRVAAIIYQVVCWFISREATIQTTGWTSKENIFFLFIYFVNYNTIINYILNVCELSNFDHMRGVVSQSSVSGRNRTIKGTPKRNIKNTSLTNSCQQLYGENFKIE